MQLYYASRDGQARKIATRIAERLAGHGISATPADLAIMQPSPAELAQADLVVAVLAVRYGRHLPEAVEFVKTFALLYRPPPLALASVNLTARKPGKDTPEGSVYLRKLIARYKLKPALATAFAGKLDYPRYSFSDKHIIRFIMLITGGPTDPSTVVEYTDWDKVNAFADGIAETYMARPDLPPTARPHRSA
jgi:menaquinone-dependent protoporphyrinogen oxidase